MIIVIIKAIRRNVSEMPRRCRRDMFLYNQVRLLLNDQNITSPLNEPHRSPGFA